MSETIRTPYGDATDNGDAIVRYVMHNERPPLELTQALRDEAESLRADRDALAERLLEIEDAALHADTDDWQSNRTLIVELARAALARVGR